MCACVHSGETACICARVCTQSRTDLAVWGPGIGTPSISPPRALLVILFSLHALCCTLRATRCIAHDACRTLHVARIKSTARLLHHAAHHATHRHCGAGACCMLRVARFYVARCMLRRATHRPRAATRQRRCIAPALRRSAPARSLTGTSACSAHAGRLQLRHWAPTAAGCSRRRPPWPVRSSRSGVPQYPRQRVLPVPPRVVHSQQACPAPAMCVCAHRCASGRVCLFAPQPARGLVRGTLAYSAGPIPHECPAASVRTRECPRAIRACACASIRARAHTHWCVRTRVCAFLRTRACGDPLRVVLRAHLCAREHVPCVLAHA
jgi:hypothetical protein